MSLIQFPETSAQVDYLKNNFTLITDENFSHKVVSVQLWVETGSMHESPQLGSGLSHLLEHMVFKGTKSFSGEYLSQKVEELGGSWNAYTTYDRTVYYIDGPSEAVEEFISFLYELVYLPTLPKADFETERDVIRREISMGNDDPNSLLWETHLENLYQVDTRRYPIIGYEEVFDKVTHEDMVNYHREHYTFDNSFLVVSGSFEREKTIEQINALSEGYSSSFSKAKILPSEPSLLGIKAREKQFNVPHVKSTLSWIIPESGHKDTFALEVLANILGGNRSSPLYQSLREQQQLVLNISSWTWNSTGSDGVFSISAEYLSEHDESYISALLDELEKVDLLQLETLLQTTVRQLMISQFKTLTTASGRGSDLASNWHEARDLNLTKSFLAKIEKITLEDLVRVKENYLRPDRYVLTTLTPNREEQSSQTECTEQSVQVPTVNQLSNGVELLSLKDDSLPLVYFQYIFKGGLTLETPDEEGIGTLHSILLGKGTEKRSAFEFIQTLESLGASVSFSGGNNTFMVSGNCLRADLEQVSDLIFEVFECPLFDSAQLEQEKELLIAKIEESAQDPIKVAFWNARRNLFVDSPYQFSRLGAVESVSEIDQEKLRKFHEKQIRQQKLVVSLFGDLEEDNLSFLKRKCEGLERRDEPEILAQVEYSSGEITEALDKEQAAVVFAYPGVSVFQEETILAEVLQDYLSSMSGPLFSRFREELGLVYYVSATQFVGINGGMFSLYFGTSPEQKDQAIDELKMIITHIAKNGISDSDLNRIKQSIKGSYIMQNQSLSSLSRSHGINALFGKGVEYHERYVESLEKVELKELNAFAQQLLSQKPVISIVSQ